MGGGSGASVGPAEVDHPGLRRLLSSRGLPRLRGVGLMSGTSVDGIDAALVEVCPGSDTAGPLVRLLHFHESPYSLPGVPDDLQARLRKVLADPQRVGADAVCGLNVEMAEAFARAAGTACRRWLELEGKSPPQQGGEDVDVGRACVGTVDFVACHGQTLWHAPQSRSTLQVGDVSVLAERTGVTTVGNFRPRDMAAGGVGAPLMPFVDAAVFNKGTPRMLLNVGGIANVTVLDGRGGTVAYDTGPGNMVMDEVLRVLGPNVLSGLSRATKKRRTEGEEFMQVMGQALDKGYDVDGKVAGNSALSGYQCMCDFALREGPFYSGAGGVDILSQYSQHSAAGDPFEGAKAFLAQRGPKATGREQFGQRFALDLAHAALTRFFDMEQISDGVRRRLISIASDPLLSVDPDEYGRVLADAVGDLVQKDADKTVEYFCQVMAVAMHLTASTVAAHVVRETEALAGSCAEIELVVSGGGAQNALLMENISCHISGMVDARNHVERAEPLPRVRVVGADTLQDASGVTANAKEAIGFALLGYCSLFGIPANMPSVTGASGPVVLGTVSPGLPGKSFNFFKFHDDGCASVIADAQ